MAGSARRLGAALVVVGLSLSVGVGAASAMRAHLHQGVVQQAEPDTAPPTAPIAAPAPETTTDVTSEPTASIAATKPESTETSAPTTPSEPADTLPAERQSAIGTRADDLDNSGAEAIDEPAPSAPHHVAARHADQPDPADDPANDPADARTTSADRGATAQSTDATSADLANDSAADAASTDPTDVTNALEPTGTEGTDAGINDNGTAATDSTSDAKQAASDATDGRASSADVPDRLGLRGPDAVAFPTFEPAEHLAPMQHAQTIAVTAMAVVAAAAAAAPAAAARAGRSGGARASRSSRGTNDSASGASSSNEREYAEVYTGDAAFATAVLLDPGRGDRSKTWRAPLTENVDNLSRTMPSRLARISPLLSMLVADGTWARAMFGSVAAMIPVGGVAVGVAAGIDAHGSYLPPALGFVGALMILGIFDAGAGFLASIAFGATTLVLGGVPTPSQFRAMAGLVVLWFAPVIIAGATRPLRRELDASIDTRLDRIGDVLIGSMTAVWCSQGFTYGQNALTGLQLPIADRYVLLGWIAFAALVARYAIESAVDRWYPVRLSATDPGELDAASLAQRCASLVARAGFYLFVAAAFFPINTKVIIATGVMLFGVFGYWEGFTSRFPNSERLYKWMPAGFPLALIIVVATDRITAWLNHVEPDPNTRLLQTFVLVSVPVLLSTLLAVLARDGERPAFRTWHRLAAVPLLVLCAHYMFGLFHALPVPSLFRA